MWRALCWPEPQGIHHRSWKQSALCDFKANLLAFPTSPDSKYCYVMFPRARV